MTFTPTDDGTRVTLVHSGFEGHNEEPSLRGAIGGDGGWSGLLAGYAEAVG